MRRETDADVRDRFWSKVDKNGPVPAHRPDLGPCWLWTAYRLPKGYGSISVRGRHVQAHRFALCVHLGRPLRAHALHHCDNPPCVNPNHLFEGTDADNSLDKHSKGRQRWARGERIGKAKLTASLVRRIREAHESGELGYKLAERYGVTPANISCIIKRTTWRHI